MSMPEPSEDTLKAEVRRLQKRITELESEGRGGSISVGPDLNVREQLSRIQRAFSELVERAPFGIYVVDSQFRIAYMNSSSQTALFQKVRPVIGRDLSEVMRCLWPEPVLTEIVGHFRHTFETGEAYYSAQFVNPHRGVGNGESYEWELHPITLPDGQSGVVCYYSESPRLREAQTELVHMRNLLGEGQKIAHMGTFEYIAETRTTVWSEEEYRIYGIDPSGPSPAYDTMLARSIHPDDVALLHQVFTAAMQNSAIYELEHKIVRPDGSVRWVYDRAHPYLDQNGKLVRYIGATLDITERKQAEEALRESESKFRTLANAIPQLCWMANAEGWVFWYNERWYQYTGTTAEKMEGWGWQSVHDPEELPAVLERWKRSIATGELFEMIYPLRGADGMFRPFLTRVMPVRGSDGKVTGWFGTNTDISAQKQAEAEVRKTKDLLEEFVKNAPIALAMFDRNMRYIRVSDAWLRNTGLDHRSILGLSHYDVFPDLPEHWKDAHRRGMAGDASQAEDEWIALDGQAHAIRWGVHPWGDAGAETGGIIISFEDITEQKRAHDEKQRLEQQLAHAQKMECVGRLAGGIAHDFNNLISAILLNADSAMDESANGDPAKQSITAIQDTAQRAIALGRQLMTFSQKQVLQTELLDLNCIIAENLQMIRRLIGEDVKVVFDPGPLALVKADRGQLGQVIVNLAVNSRDAMPQGGTFELRTCRMELQEGNRQLIAAAKPGSYVVLKVKDNGTGMNAGTLARAFEPFFTTKGFGKGTGLGLSVVYGIVNQMEGFIAVESELGKGTEFTIHLPTVFGVPAGSSEIEESPIRGGSETVLLTEDEPALREKIAQVLARAGYHILTAADGNQALQLNIENSGPIHLLLTDVVMPDLSGYRLAERLKILRPQMRVLYISGYPDLSSEGAVLETINFIPKPFTKEKLLRKVREILDGGFK